MARIFFLFLVSIFISCITLSQNTGTGEINILTVYGYDFAFNVKNPDKWSSYITNAEENNSSVFIYKSNEDLDRGGALIQINNYKKQDEETNKDLDFDISVYNKQYDNLNQEELNVSHPVYDVYSKTIFVNDGFYQYIVYINPGAGFRTGISVVMNVSERPATDEELKAFEEVVASLNMISG